MVAAHRLYEKHTQDELLRMQEVVSADPASRNTAGGIHLYTPAVRKQLSAIAQAIAWKVEDTRAAAGRPVPTAGYSGRRSNR